MYWWRVVETSRGLRGDVLQLVDECKKPKATKPRLHLSLQCTHTAPPLLFAVATLCPDMSGYCDEYLIHIIFIISTSSDNWRIALNCDELWLLWLLWPGLDHLCEEGVSLKYGGLALTLVAYTMPTVYNMHPELSQSDVEMISAWYDSEMKRLVPGRIRPRDLFHQSIMTKYKYYQMRSLWKTHFDYWVEYCLIFVWFHGFPCSLAFWGVRQHELVTNEHWPQIASKRSSKWKKAALATLAADHCWSLWSETLFRLQNTRIKEACLWLELCCILLHGTDGRAVPKFRRDLLLSDCEVKRIYWNALPDKARAVRALGCSQSAQMARWCMWNCSCHFRWGVAAQGFSRHPPI